jgi:hypothetical protein
MNLREFVLTNRHIAILSLILFGASLGFYQNCSVPQVAQLNSASSTTGTNQGDPNLPPGSVDTELLTVAVPYKSIAVGLSFSCGLTGQNTIKCWGNPFYTVELGNNAAGSGGARAERSNVPIDVLGLSSIRAIVAGGYHACVLKSDRTVACWGDNTFGQLGVSSSLSSSFNPVAVPNLANVDRLSAGHQHTCALLKDQTVKCWGVQRSGQVGNGVFSETGVGPTLVTGLTGVTSLSVFGSHSCAVSGGQVKCWGRNTDGELGDNTVTDSAVPKVVVGISSARSVSVGGSHTCALLLNKAVMCWGKNNAGQLGAGTVAGSRLPIAVTGLSAISASSSVDELRTYQTSNCVRLADGTAKCWGDNFYAQIGNVTVSYGTGVPLLEVQSYVIVGTDRNVGPLAGVSRFDGGANTPCAFLTNGKASCWGSNGAWQIGNGKSTFAEVLPVEML